MTACYDDGRCVAARAGRTGAFGYRPHTPTKGEPQGRRAVAGVATRPYAGRPALTPRAIYAAALEIAGEEGFAALTMRRLADALGVTVRALYHHVADRQEVVDGVARLLVAGLPRHEFDVADWRGSIRRLFHDARAAYRRHPRALLIAMDERVTPAGVEQERLLSPERMVAFFCELGLPLPDALALRMQLLTQVLGFVLGVDYAADRAPEATRLLDPVPAPWLDAFPDVPVPRMREAAAAPAIGPDDLFEQIIDGVIRSLEPIVHLPRDEETP